MVVVQDVAADAQDHGPVAPHQRLEGRGLVPRQEAIEEMGVGGGAVVVQQRDAPQVGEDAMGAGGHGPSLARRSVCTLVLPGPVPARTAFSRNGLGAGVRVKMGSVREQGVCAPGRLPQVEGPAGSASDRACISGAAAVLIATAANAAHRSQGKTGKGDRVVCIQARRDK
jgi:hypothetical protein